MKELIPITTADIGGTAINAVNARELHDFLENKDRYTTWIKDRIEQFGFVENQDFVTFSENSEKGRPRKEYFVSIDMAKELAMVERNAKGKEARLYFIECERIAKQKQSAPALPDFTDPAAAAVAWAEQYRARQDLEARIEEDKPKVAFTEQVLASNVTLSPTETAKLIGYPPRKFGDYLRQIRAVWATKNLAMQWMLDKGLMVHRFHAVVHADKTVEEKPYPHFTTAGVFYIYRRMLKEGLIERNSQIELSMK